MSLPRFDAFALPVLAVLAASPDGLAKRDLYDRVAQAAGISPEARSESIRSGEERFTNRVGWACSWMKACGWVDNPRRAWWTITDAGRKRLALGTAITAVEMRPRADIREREPSQDHPIQPGVGLMEPATTPHERIDDAVAEIEAELRSRILDRLGTLSPLFFERTVLHLLEVMGYAGQRGHVEHAGRSGDGGLDGILYADRLHLERVYVQAKRWAGSVGASVVRDFAGAMDAESATKGVILTTSDFTKDAQRYVERSPKAIRLVSGAELAELMIEFGVGVSRERSVVLPAIDEDFFEA